MAQQTDNPLDENGYPVYGTFRQPAKQQTAVEWLVDIIERYIEHLSEEELDNLYNMFKQAKAMEMEQMEDCWIAAHQAGRFEGKGIAEEDWQTFFNYYNETYSAQQ